MNITSQTEWDNLATSCTDYTFLQSWQIGELYVRQGKPVWRLMWAMNDQPIALCLITKVTAKRGVFLQGRNGPIFSPEFYALDTSKQSDLIRQIGSDLQELGRKNGCDYVRIQPMWELKIEGNSDRLSMLNRNGFLPAQIHNIDAEKTLILDLNKSTESILANMHRKTRYNIRKAEKNNIKVEIYNPSSTIGFDPIAEFYKIHESTSRRQQFSSNPLSYYQDLAQVMNNNNCKLEVALAKFEEEYVVAAIIMYYKDKAFYTDGGSLAAYNHTAASYMLQWEVIKHAKGLGCSSYNFWSGVVPTPGDTKHPWAGVDTFKRGFGGLQFDYPHIQDSPLSWKYNLVRIWEFIEKRRRGY